MLLTEAARGYLMDGQIERQSPRGLKLKEARLGRFVIWCTTQGVTTLEDVTSQVTRGFVVHLQQQRDRRALLAPARELSPWTIAGHVRTMRAFFRWCKAEGLLGEREEPTARIPRIKMPEKVIQTFTPEQLEAMLQTCDRTTAKGYRDYTILLVLMDTGIRASELVQLTLDQIHDTYLTVVGKGDKEREVGLGPTTAKALWKYVHQYRKPRSDHEWHVFISRFGGKLSYLRLYEIVGEAGERAGIAQIRLSPHTFRHTFAKSYLKNGGDVFKLSRLLGHTEVDTTQIYLRDFRSSEARLDHQQFSPVERFRLGRRAPKKRTGGEA